LEGIQEVRMTNQCPTFISPMNERTLAIEVNHDFRRLRDAIAEHPMIDLKIEEFMRMHKNHEGVWFKHYGTRNYICLTWDEEVHIPRTGEAFYRGEF